MGIFVSGSIRADVSASLLKGGRYEDPYILSGSSVVQSPTVPHLRGRRRGGGGFLVPAEGGAQSPHDTTMISQHNALSGQVTTHDAAQTSQHNDLSSQITNVQTAVDNLSTADHSGLPPAWDKVLPADDPGGACPSNSSRFTCVMGGLAVRDNETGLVWEQSPNTTLRSWSLTLNHCANRKTGERMGWRLPSAPELASLVDPNNPGGDPDLPPGHPFNNILLNDYWSATTNADNSAQAWDVNFEASDVLLTNDKISSPALGWCVRGGVNAGQH